MSGEHILSTKRKREDDIELPPGTAAGVHSAEDGGHDDDGGDGATAIEALKQTHSDNKAGVSAVEGPIMMSGAIQGLSTDSVAADDATTQHDPTLHDAIVQDASVDTNAGPNPRETMQTIRMPNGDVAYFKPSFIEDPWAHLETK